MAWLEITKSLFTGLFFGSLVAFFNHWLVWSLMKKGDQYSPAVFKNKLMIRYIMRYFVNVLALATYLLHKETFVLVGTAVALSIVGKILAINYNFLKKGVN